MREAAVRRHDMPISGVPTEYAGATSQTDERAYAHAHAHTQTTHTHTHTHTHALSHAHTLTHAHHTYTHTYTRTDMESQRDDVTINVLARRRSRQFIVRQKFLKTHESHPCDVTYGRHCTTTISVLFLRV